MYIGGDLHQLRGLERGGERADTEEGQGVHGARGDLEGGAEYGYGYGGGSTKWYEQSFGPWG